MQLFILNCDDSCFLYPFMGVFGKEVILFYSPEYLSVHPRIFEGQILSKTGGGGHQKFPCIMTWWVPFFAQLTRKYQVPREGVICTGNVYQSTIFGNSKAFFSNFRLRNPKICAQRAISSTLLPIYG